MKVNAYTLYDVKSETYSPPFFTVSHGAATRLVSDLVADPNTMPGRHPKDYTLYCIGSFDDASGLLLQSDKREHISDAVSLVPHQPTELFDRQNPDRPPVADLSQVTAATIDQMRKARR